MALSPAGRILSIQSHVAYGHVGNRAAVFPLERRGHDVIVVNTVQFSNHTGYGAWEGDVFSADHIERILKGLEERGALAGVTALLTGYMGDAAIAGIIRTLAVRLRARNPGFVYACDPVMGDTGRGLFVKPGIPEFFRDELCACADILTPNLFELEWLTGIPCRNEDDIRMATKILHDKGCGVVLVTSVPGHAADNRTIGMVVSSRDGDSIFTETPRLPLDPAPNGAGDLTAALFLSYWLESRDPGAALSRTADAVFKTFEATHALNRRELALVQAQDSFG